jgi:hypothetical protein
MTQSEHGYDVIIVGSSLGGVASGAILANRCCLAAARKSGLLSPEELGERRS